MVWTARTGAQWRHLPDEYGKWNNVFRRYRRWVMTGVFEVMPKALAAVVERVVSADMIDSTVVPAHHCAVGLKKGSGIRGARPVAWPVHHQGPSEFAEGLHARCDGQGPPLYERLGSRHCEGSHRGKPPHLVNRVYEMIKRYPASTCSMFPQPTEVTGRLSRDRLLGVAVGKIGRVGQHDHLVLDVTEQFQSDLPVLPMKP